MRPTPNVARLAFRDRRVDADFDTGVVYVTVGAAEFHHTIELVPGVNIDFAVDGSVVGVEVLP